MKSLSVLLSLLCMTMLISCDRVLEEDLYKQQTVEEENIFDAKPLKILMNSKYNNYGPDLIMGWNMTSKFHNILDEIGLLCEETFGYNIEFISFPDSGASNEYLVALQSGLEFDLIFPTKVYTHVATQGDNAPYYFWNDEFIEMYMDLSPYLNTYAPEVYMHMKSFDYVMDYITRNDKVYAMYAGVPDVGHNNIFVKNEILEMYSVTGIKNFTELFGLMEVIDMNQELNDHNKIMASNNSLLEYAMNKAGYYPVNQFRPGSIVCKLDDPHLKPYLIEDTNILDVFFEEFSPFFDRSYFQCSTNEGFQSLYTQDGVDLYMNAYVSHLFCLDKNQGENPWNTYTLYVLDQDQTIIKNFDSIQLIPVPYTCTQPEKAISFINWLFTDEDVGDMLTFGTDKGKYPGYKITSDGRIAYEQNTHTVYLLDNLLANFSNRLFPYDNKSLDGSKDYIALAQKTTYPPLYRFLETNHNENMRSFELMDLNYYNDPILKQREEYITGSLRLLFEDPKAITAHEMKTTLDSMTDKDAALKQYKDFVEKLFR